MCLRKLCKPGILAMSKGHDDEPHCFLEKTRIHICNAQDIVNELRSSMSYWESL